MNVNYPDLAPAEVAGVAATRQGHRDQGGLHIEERSDTWGDPYFWVGFERRRSDPPEGTDLWAIANGMISVTPLSLNLTHEDTRKRLESVLSLPVSRPPERRGLIEPMISGRRMDVSLGLCAPGSLVKASTGEGSNRQKLIVPATCSSLRDGSSGSKAEDDVLEREAHGLSPPAGSTRRSSLPHPSDAAPLRPMHTSRANLLRADLDLDSLITPFQPHRSGASETQPDVAEIALRLF